MHKLLLPFNGNKPIKQEVGTVLRSVAICQGLLIYECSSVFLTLCTGEAAKLVSPLPIGSSIPSNSFLACFPLLYLFSV